jgi:hypothetical protein
VKKTIPSKKEAKKDSGSGSVFIDENTERFNAPKIYQYSQVEKQKLCMDDEDFMKFIKRNFKSLKHRENLEDQISDIKPLFRRKMNNILYPEKSVLD